MFVTLPFVVRSVQPVLIELDREVEEAAASLGASNFVIFRRIILPALRPAIVSGAALAFARCVGEIGSLILIVGNVQIASIVIFADIESDAPKAAASLSLVLILVSLVVLFLIRRLGGRVAHCRRARWSLRTVALLYLLLLLLLRSRSCSADVRARVRGGWGWITTPAAVSAFWLSLTMAAIAVPLNTIFGVVCALVLVRRRGRAAAVIDSLSTCRSWSRR